MNSRQRRMRKCCLCTSIKKGSKYIGCAITMLLLVCICTFVTDPILAGYFALLSAAPTVCFLISLWQDNSQQRRSFYIAYKYCSALSQLYALLVILTLNSSLVDFCTQQIKIYYGNLSDDDFELHVDTCHNKMTLIILVILATLCFIHIHFCFVLRQNWMNKLPRQI